VQPAAEPPAKVPDLMAALEASIKAVKDRGDAEGNGGTAKKKPASGSRKRAPAKKRSTAKSKS
jgi:non-homologous end joining protein Ku